MRQPIPRGFTLVHRYQIERALGRGGLATTYLAHDVLFDAPVALKLIDEEALAHEPALRHEFALLAGLVHPHLVEVHDFSVTRELGPPRGLYTAGYVEGETLSLFARGRRWCEVAEPFADALEALAFLHGVGLRHGDFKPDNVVVSPEGAGTLIDLSCATTLEAARLETLSGSRGFVAPEQLGGRSDRRSDLYAVGRTLQALERLVVDALPSALARSIAQLVATDPAARPTDAGELLDVLGREGSVAPLPEISGRLRGREEELRRFQRWLTEVLHDADTARVFCLCGAEGVGKTRLLDEMKWSAQMSLAVVEARAGARDAIASCLTRARGGRRVGSSVRGVIDAIQELGEANAALLVVLDDAQALEPRDRKLWDALVASVEPGKRLAVVYSDRDAPQLRADRAQILTIEPLSRQDVADWLGDRLPAARLDAVMQLTGGFPRDILALARELATSDLALGDLEQAAARASRWVTRELACLSLAEKCLLARVAAAGGWLVASGDDLEGLASLAARGLVVRRGPAWALRRGGDSAAIARELGPALMEPAHAALAARLERELDSGAEVDDPARLGALCHHLGEASKWEHVSDRLERHRRARRRAPHAFLRAAHGIVTAARAGAVDSELVLAAAEIFEAAGSLPDALAALALAARRRPAMAVRRRIRALAGACYTKLGVTHKALRQLRLALAESQATPELADQLSLALLRAGRASEAEEVARQAMGGASDPDTLGQLHADAATALSYLGRPEDAAQQLALASSLDVRDERARLRIASAHALVAHRRGDATRAAEHFSRAQDIAEGAGFDDLVAPTALNVGVARHQLGDWGGAMRAYESGLRFAVALGMTSTEATLRCNLAKLHADIGGFERALAQAHRAERLANELSQTFLRGAALAVRAEALRWQRDFVSARDCLARARALFSDEHAAREVAEVELMMVETALDAGDAAGDELTAIEQAVERVGAADLVARAAMVRGRDLARRDPAAAIAHLEHAVERAGEACQLGLLAQATTWLASTAASAGCAAMAENNRTRAREMCERIRASLDAPLRERFERHPLRASMSGIATTTEREGGLESRHVRLLLAISRRLSLSPSPSQLLDATMDGAIELTGAERGFVIVVMQGGSALHVPVARNIDREKVGRKHLKFSKTIAKKVIDSGDPIIAFDASEDERFVGHPSVHAMRLKSVLCVPIRTPEGVAGAVYLDNRFRKGGFSENDATLMLSLSDHVGVALTNARLREELAQRTRDLEQRTRELEAERERGERLLEAQKRQIGLLSAELEKSQRPAASSYAYQSIVGESAAMRRVFDTLDRVVAKDVTVLIRGESGTGKELVARAIHENSPRASAPFVAINCGALPETLLEAELFGYAPGAFTGASRDHPGLFAAASGGTLFLDEIGEMSMAMQVKLLRVLQERQVQPLGTTRPVAVDVRVVAATHRDLAAAIAEGRFRDDLYYRIAVVEVKLPPLRERPEDIPVLANAIVHRAAKQLGVPVPRLDLGALRLLLSHSWPGNVRQLENVLTKACVLADGATVRAEDLDGLASAQAPRRRGARPEDKRRIMAALEECDWNVSQAAALLAVPRSTFYRKLRAYGLSRPRP